jgi:hypothetical protein
MRKEHVVAMPNKQRLIVNLTEAKHSPIFEVCQRKSVRGWYVRVLWHYGQEHYVGGFASADEAQSWIDKKSIRWLQNRAAALRVV